MRRIHHLNCGSLCPRGGKMFGAGGGPFSPAPMCCHCLLIEGEDGLVLVDSGLGVEDVTEPRRLGFMFRAMARPKLEVAETALRQVADLGFRPSDVRHVVPTHLDLDHAGGIGDFPAAAVHVFAAELSAASNPSLTERSRYCAARSPGSSNGRLSKKRAIAGSASRRCERSLEPATRCCSFRFRAIRAGTAAWRSGDPTTGCSIAATPIFIIPRSRRGEARRRGNCACSSGSRVSTMRSESPIRPACASSHASPEARSSSSHRTMSPSSRR